MIDRLSPLQLGDDPRPTSVPPDGLPDTSDFLPASHEREGHVIDPQLEPQFEVRQVLCGGGSLGQRRVEQRHSLIILHSSRRQRAGSDLPGGYRLHA